MRFHFGRPAGRSTFPGSAGILSCSITGATLGAVRDDEQVNSAGIRIK
jgi:hypothetical protein